MNLFYNYSDIIALDMFSWCDFSSFTSFEQLITTIIFNILFYLFLIMFMSIVYKIIVRFINFIF